MRTITNLLYLSGKIVPCQLIYQFLMKDLLLHKHAYISLRVLMFRFCLNLIEKTNLHFIRFNDNYFTFGQTQTENNIKYVKENNVWSFFCKENALYCSGISNTLLVITLNWQCASELILCCEGLGKQTNIFRDFCISRWER